MATLKFLNKRVFDSGINHAHIALISKISNPSKASDFRPMSLCNVVHKISKAFVNRLKPTLPTIIFKSQSAFIPRRLIMDNVIVAYEAFHTMKTRQRGLQSCMTIKLNISKAYDRIE